MFNPPAELVLHLILGDLSHYHVEFALHWLSKSICLNFMLYFINNQSINQNCKLSGFLFSFSRANSSSSKKKKLSQNDRKRIAALSFKIDRSEAKNVETSSFSIEDAETLSNPWRVKFCAISTLVSSL